jgi:hypothetical protein
MRLVAVYGSERSARAAAAAARSVGASPDDIHVGATPDQIASVKGEMREEMDRTIAGPGNVGPFTPKMAKGMTVGAVLGALFGLVMALPLAIVDFGGWPTWLRLIVVAVAGVAAGATVGWIVGGGFGAERPDDPLAAEHGVTVSVPATPEIETALVTAHPMRVDLVTDDGTPVRPIYSEPDESIAHGLGRNMADEGRSE